MLRELAAAVECADRDEQVHVVVLSSAVRACCVGDDLLRGAGPWPRAQGGLADEEVDAHADPIASVPQNQLMMQKLITVRWLLVCVGWSPRKSQYYSSFSLFSSERVGRRRLERLVKHGLEHGQDLPRSRRWGATDATRIVRLEARPRKGSAGADVALMQRRNSKIRDQANVGQNTWDKIIAGCNKA